MIIIPRPKQITTEFSGDIILVLLFHSIQLKWMNDYWVRTRRWFQRKQNIGEQLPIEINRYYFRNKQTVEIQNMLSNLWLVVWKVTRDHLCQECVHLLSSWSRLVSNSFVPLSHSEPSPFRTISPHFRFSWSDFIDLPLECTTTLGSSTHVSPCPRATSVVFSVSWAPHCPGSVPKTRQRLRLMAPTPR